jgi:hypothetical protein
MALLAVALASCGIGPHRITTTFPERGATTTLTVDDQLGFVTGVEMIDRQAQVIEDSGPLTIDNPGGRQDRLWLIWRANDCPESVVIVMAAAEGGYSLTVTEGADHCPPGPAFHRIVELRFSRLVPASDVVKREVRWAPD